MAVALIERDGQRILVADATGPLISRVQDALDLMSQAWGHKASVIAVPVARFDPEFFRLRSGLAGEITQKFVNYRSKLAVIGDISEKAAESVALRDFVRMQPPQLDLLPARPRRPRRQALRPLTGMLRPRLARAGNPALLSRSSAKFFGI